MRYYTKSECALSAQASYDGTTLIVGLDNYPLTVSLGKITPTDARTFAAMLIEQADKCDVIAADSARLATIIAMAADEREVA